MRRALGSWWMALVVAAVGSAGCGDDEGGGSTPTSSASSGQGGDDAGSGGTGGSGAGTGTGGSGAGTGTGGSGGAASTGPDADDGPPWDGTTSITSRVLVEEANWAVVLRDGVAHQPENRPGELLFAPFDGSAPQQVVALPEALQGGISFWGWGTSAILLSPSGSDQMFGWSEAAGFVEGLDMPRIESLFAADDGRCGFAYGPGEDGALRGVRIDLDSLTPTPVALGVDAEEVRCVPLASSLVCVELGGPDVRAFTVTTSSLTEGGTFPGDGSGGYEVELVAGDGYAVIEQGSQLYRLDEGGAAPVAIASGLVPDYPGVGVHQGGWISYRTPAGLRAIRSDGSDGWMVAEGEVYSVTGDGDDRRRTLLPYYVDGGLNVVDLESRARTPVCDADCSFKSITYSDRYVLYFDDIVETGDPLNPRVGTYRVLDVVTGEVRTLSDQGFEIDARPIGKSKWLLDWLAFGFNSYLGYFDAHSVPAADILPLPILSRFDWMDVGGPAWTTLTPNADESAVTVTRFEP